MSSSVCRRVVFGVLALSILTGLVVDSLRKRDQDDNPLRLVRRPPGVQTRDDAALLSGWLDEVDDGWEVGKNHQRVRAAFRDIVAEARQATVRILRGDQQVALGTVVDTQGYVLTKASEVLGPDTIVCQFHDGRRRAARIAGSSQRNDLAMLKVEIDGLTAAPWTTSKSPPAVGSLLATPHLGRDPLALGVVSLEPQPVANDSVLGIGLRDSSEGPLVSDVVVDSAADRAGLQSGDVVLQIDRQGVPNSDELKRLIGQRLPGDSVSLWVRRGQENLLIEAKLGRRTDLDLENSDFQSFLGGQLSFRRTGFESVLQHDTFLLPEHCGGPLCDLDGHVVGINIARAERIASYALPAAMVLPWIDELKSGRSDSLIVRRNDSRDRRTRAAASAEAAAPSAATGN
jgi:serine protease Do